MNDYALMTKQLESLAGDPGEGSRWWVSLLSNASAVVFSGLDRINWAGFYIARGDELLLGPFQGKTACMRIPRGKGVCGTAFALGKTVVVPDVGQFPGHIACDPESRSEIVIPIFRNGKAVGVLDIDSPEKERFSEFDREGLENFAAVLEKQIEW
ncbi:MAG: GAF domain-containing protein [Clostridia bacterium]|nr:GAF domain-containing protein [Clostridia bacterium]